MCVLLLSTPIFNKLARTRTQSESTRKEHLKVGWLINQIRAGAGIIVELVMRFPFSPVGFHFPQLRFPRGPVGFTSHAWFSLPTLRFPFSPVGFTSHARDADNPRKHIHLEVSTTHYSFAINPRHCFHLAHWMLETHQSSLTVEKTPCIFTCPLIHNF